MLGFNPSLSPLCKTTCLSLGLVRGEWKKASQLIDEMQRKGLKPDRYSYTSAIHACGKARSPLEALRLLRAMDTNNVGIRIRSPRALYEHEMRAWMYYLCEECGFWQPLLLAQGS